MRPILILLAIAALVGCTDGRRFGVTPEDRAVPLQEGWEYRWGDLPPGAAGEWTPQVFGEWPKGGNGRHNLWQRIKLPELADDEQVLFVRGAWMLFEASVDGKVVYKYGEMGEDGRGFFPGQAWHWVPLHKADSGKYLHFRFYSSDTYIGVYDGARLGTRADHVIGMLRRDVTMIVMGAIYIALGLIMVFMFSRNHAERINISFGIFAIAIGVYENCRTFLKQFLFHDPLLWGNIELTAFFVVPLSFCWFTENMLGPGPFKIIRRVWQINLAYIVFAYARLLIAGDALWSSLYIFQYFFLTISVVVTALIGHAAVKGNAEARFFFGGVIIVVCSAVHDVLVSIGLIKGIGVINHMGMFFLISSLALIVGRRYFLTIALRKNVELASAVQNLLLPKQKAGSFGPFEYASFYQPHGRMSGDWMNFWTTSQGEQRLLFGDVIGKGPRAALAVAAIAAFIENAKDSGDSLEACIERINSGLGRLFGGHIYSTLSALTLGADGQVELYNCGGIGWIRAGVKAEHIMMPSSVLGIGDHPVIARKPLDLLPGECLFAFTDGVLEGTRAIMRLIRALNDKPQGLALEEVFATATRAGVASKVHEDDRSIVAVRRTALR